MTSQLEEIQQIMDKQINILIESEKGPMKANLLRHTTTFLEVRLSRTEEVFKAGDTH